MAGLPEVGVERGSIKLFVDIVNLSVKMLFSEQQVSIKSVQTRDLGCRSLCSQR